MSALRFDVRIASQERTLVDIKDFEIARGQVTFLFGESGIGKSLLSRAIYGILDPDEFRVTINDETYRTYLDREETRERKKNGFFVFQEPSSHLNPLLTLQTQLNEGSLAGAPDDSGILQRLWDASDREDVKDLLAVYPKPYRPSGGEKQRMFLVMALKKIEILMRSTPANANHMFIFDEPTGSLDNHYRDVFLALLFNRFRQYRLTVLLITHDYSMISQIARAHQDLMEQLSFKEMNLRQGRLVLETFQPSVYLGWLGNQKKDGDADELSSGKQPLLRVESGAKVFGQTLVVSRDVEGKEVCPLEVCSGHMVYLKAPSGTGKTTLMKMIMGLVRGDHLRLHLNGTVITERTARRFWQNRLWGRKLTMVFQHADEALNPRSTVAETFQGLPVPGKITGDGIKGTLRELFDFDITDEFLSRRVDALSGGQKQRLNLLRSLSLNTDILILDEPINGLDFESITKVLSMIGTRQRSGKGILLVSHNEEIFDALVPRRNVYYLHTQAADLR